MFAQFFMKYFKNNPEFMYFERNGDNNGTDYLCDAHNSFDRILRDNPNRIINTNTHSQALSPWVVAQSCGMHTYRDIDAGNEPLAEMVGRYGYSQSIFLKMQDDFNCAKRIKGKAALTATQPKIESGVNYRILAKNDPLGFVLGNITNCCQTYTHKAVSCVVNGYKNSKAGFLVFEEKVLDKKGRLQDIRILAQSYVWYNRLRRTVCLDNIEMPEKIYNEHYKDDSKMNRFLQTVEDAAQNIMVSMNANNRRVNQVRLGSGYLGQELRRCVRYKFGAPKRWLKPRHPLFVYSDAKKYQFVLTTYDKQTKDKVKDIRKVLSDANADLEAAKKAAKNTATQESKSKKIDNTVTVFTENTAQSQCAEA
jgi:hypothetical protein